MAETSHEWHFSSVSQGQSLFAIAICGKCGLSRSGLVSRGTAKVKYLDLSGECGDTPEPQEPHVAWR